MIVSYTCPCSPTAETEDLKSFQCRFESDHGYSTKYIVVGNKMEYTLSQAYCFYMGQVVRMYFIQNLPYTFDELPQIVQDHPSVQTQALGHRDYDDEDMYQWSNYLIMEEMHPLLFELPIQNPELLPQDD